MEKIKFKQVPCVIVNKDGELYAGVTTDHEWWTNLIVNATLFNNAYLAREAIKATGIKGEIMKLHYTLEKI